MLMADTMAIFFVILGLLLAFPGLWLLCRGVWPQAVTGAAEACRNGLLKPFLLGLPLTCAVILAAVIIGKAGSPGAITATALVCFYLVFAQCGVAGLATKIGMTLGSSKDQRQPWRATLRGGIALELAWLLPILGWFLLLPVATTIGSGALLLALWRKRLAAKTTQPAAPFAIPSAAAPFAESTTAASRATSSFGDRVTGGLRTER